MFFPLKLHTSFLLLEKMDSDTIIKKCGASRCRTCPFIDECNVFSSNTTGVKFLPRSNNLGPLDCKSENVVYLIYCKSCNFQYVGETKNRLQKRFSNHRSSIKSGNSCQLVHKHFGEDAHGLDNCKILPIEIINHEMLDQQNLDPTQLDRSLTKLRLEREKYWIIELQTAYPYGLNSRVKGIGDFNPSQGNYHIFGGQGRRKNKKHSKRKPKRLRSKFDISLDFINRKHRELSNNGDYIHFFKTFLFGLPRLQLKVLHDNINHSDIDQRVKDMIIMISNLRLYKPVQIVKGDKRDFYHIRFKDKGLDYINISSILRNKNVLNKIPVYFSEFEPPTIGYRFNKSIAGSLFNYKQVLSEISQYDDNFSCSCESSIFKDDHHSHVISGDFNIIKNETLRNIIRKGPKYRLPQKINWIEDRKIIVDFLDTYIDKWISKEKRGLGNDSVDKGCLQNWRDEIVKIVDRKIALGKQKYDKSWSLKIEGNLKSELDRLKDLYVITPTDKAQNNILFTCKNFYIKKLKEELTKPGQLTYQLVQQNSELINDNIINFSLSKNVKVPREMIEIPLLYWIPKMHKNPIGSRFIAGSKYCSIKPLSKHFSKALKLILNHMKLYGRTVKERSNLNYYWILDNSLEFLDNIKDVKLNHMQTFDFSTLYTALPHGEIKQKFSKIFQKVFSREAKPFINVNMMGAVFSSTASSKACSFRYEDLMEILEFILDNIFVRYGNVVYKQITGIPIGLDSGQDIANLLLYCYESEYVEKVSRENLGLARKFSFCFRYIDDLFVGNFHDFGEHIYKIYPRSLDIKLEASSITEVSYLDLKIISQNSNLVFSIYDKREDFSFEIINFPYLDSCIPKNSALGVFISQLIRYSRLNSTFPDFKAKCKQLTEKLRKQGYLYKDLRRLILRFFSNRQSFISKYNLTNANDLVKEIL